MGKNYLTAIEIDLSKQSIDNQIEQNTIIFNKSRIKKKVKEIKDNLKTQFPDEPLKQIVSKEEIESITSIIINDDEAKAYRENQRIELQIKKENYSNIRQIISGLNELDIYSADIERNEIQKIDKFLTYQDLINFLESKFNLYISLSNNKKELIDNFIKNSNQIDIELEEDIDYLIKLRDIYQIDKTIDDIELYEKFNMQSNIDFSNLLGLYYAKKVSQNEYNTNIVNEFDKSFSTPLSKLFQHNIISNKLLSILLLSKTDDNQYSFVSNNKVTCLKTMWINNISNDRIYSTRTIGELFLEITNEYLGNIDKEHRQQIYMTYDGTRPESTEYYKWNGLQVFDIDLKEWSDCNIEALKKEVFNYLSDFNWFLWVCKSTSGKGLHIYSKVTPPHHIYNEPKDNEYISKYWYHINYYTKVSIIYDVFNRINKDKNNFNIPKQFFSEDSNYFEISNKIKTETGSFKNIGIDNTVGRITSGIRLTYDPNPLVNNNFLDLHIGLNLNQTLDGFNYKDTISKVLFRNTPLAKSQIDKINSFIINDLSELTLTKQKEEIDLSKFVSTGADLNQIKALPLNNINYVTRYNVCNTLAALFGNDGLSLAHLLLDSEVCKNVKEINSFYSCALTNRKNPSKLGLDILKKAGIVKSIEPELKTIVDNSFKGQLKLFIENSLNIKFKTININLEDNEYLSDKKQLLCNSESGLINSKINMIFSPPGSGKTEFIKYLAKDKKRILLVLPYISVIKNKIETDSEIMSLFECYYGSKDIKNIDYGINAVTTFDKFARSNYDKISKMFDYIFIDESHLLFTSSYRIEATSQAIKKIKELFFISLNDPFAAKLCLLTGTKTGEEYFFNNVANIINIDKKSHRKTMEFLICDDILDCTTRLANKIFELINSKHKILIPTNKGEIYSEKIIGMVEYLLGRPIKYGYYKRSNTEQEICRLINNENTIGDYEIVFCSNYLSVGVDINDKEDFASIYLGNFSAYEIEQFNSRIRKKGISSIYCLQTEKSDGTINDLLLNEPDLLLHITEEDKNRFIDDKSIAGAKQEFIAQFDPVLQKIITPGFSYLNGKISFNLEEYELISFENKYNECMQHPVKVARELSNYGYEISVSTEFEGLDLNKQEELKGIGIQAAKEEKIRKHSLLIGTFIDLINNNTYINNNGLEYNDIIGWIGKNNDLVFEDRNMIDFVKIEYDIFATPLKCTVKSKEALDSMYKPAKYLISKYSVTKVLDILNQYIDDQGILKQKNFKRAISLLKLVEASDANELSEPLTKILEKIYDFVDNFEVSKDIKLSYNSYKAILAEWTNMYIDMLGIKINTEFAFQKIEDGIVEMLSDVATKSTTKNGIKFTYNKLPDQDSNNVLNRRSVDSMIETMFRLSSEAIQENKKRNPRQKHIILQEQLF
jgi:hypothetical protein